MQAQIGERPAYGVCPRCMGFGSSLTQVDMGPLFFSVLEVPSSPCGFVCNGVARCYCTVNQLNRYSLPDTRMQGTGVRCKDGFLSDGGSFTHNKTLRRVLWDAGSLLHRYPIHEAALAGTSVLYFLQAGSS